MSQKPKETMRFATTDPNKENKHHNQIKNTGVNQQRSKDANKDITKAGPAVHKRGERADVKNVNESLTVQKDDLKLHVEKWRAERQARLAAKIIKKLGKTDIPAAVLGVSGYNVSLDTTGKSMDFSVNPADNIKPDAQKNKKSNTKAKKKPVEVRQTTASRLRMEKANPLLTIGKCTGLSSTFKLKTPAIAQVRSTNIARERITATKPTAAPKQLFKVPKCNEMKVNIGKKNAGQVQQKSSVRVVKKKSPSTFTPVNRIKKISANISGVAKLPQSTQKNKPQLSASARQKNAPTAKLNTGLRRSSSATTIRSQVSASVSGVAKLPQSVRKNKSQLSKSVTQKNVPAANQRTGLRRSSSATTFHSQVSSVQVKSLRSPSVPDISRASTVTHSSAYKSAAGLRKHETCVGFSDTPHRSSLRKSRVTLFSAPHMKTPLKTVSFTPQPDMLRRNLISWLEKRGKSLNSFGHLRCFGIHKPASEKLRTCVKESAPATKVLEGKEQSEIAQGDSKVLMPQTDQEVKDRMSDNEDALDNCSLEDLKNILSDLHKLILASYPRDQCEEWLHLIRRKFPNLDDEPSYWECLAALEEARGDYSTAIEFYSRAIVSGAETEVIDKSLDLLWEKFTSLKLESKDKVDNKKQKTPRRSVDPCQVFKSSIIKFALQQKAVKQLSANLGVEPKSLHYVATPVRRSTRKSNNPYKSSSVVCVGSLNTLQPDVRDSVVFVSNAALTPTV